MGKKNKEKSKPKEKDADSSATSGLKKFFAKFSKVINLIVYCNLV
jgi:hypothetical protein